MSLIVALKSTRTWLFVGGIFIVPALWVPGANMESKETTTWSCPPGGGLPTVIGVGLAPKFVIVELCLAVTVTLTGEAVPFAAPSGLVTMIRMSCAVPFGGSPLRIGTSAGLIGFPLPSTRTAVHPEFTVGTTAYVSSMDVMAVTVNVKI